jgi:hypothetical protein
MIVTFRQLLEAFDPLILGQKFWVDLLYDVWKQGAPMPDSIITTPNYNPIFHDDVRRFVLPDSLKYWLKEIFKHRGMTLTEEQLNNILQGKADLGDLK